MFDPDANVHRIIMSRRSLGVIVTALDYWLDDLLNEDPPQPQVRIDEVASVLDIAQSWQRMEVNP